MKRKITWSDGSVSIRTVLNGGNFVEIRYTIETPEDEDDNEFESYHRDDDMGSQ